MYDALGIISSLIFFWCLIAANSNYSAKRYSGFLQSETKVQFILFFLLFVAQVSALLFHLNSICKNHSEFSQLAGIIIMKICTLSSCVFFFIVRGFITLKIESHRRNTNVNLLLILMMSTGITIYVLDYIGIILLLFNLLISIVFLRLKKVVNPTKEE